MAYLTSTFVAGTLVVNNKIRLSDGIYPVQTLMYDIGSPSLKFKNIYANQFNGNLTGTADKADNSTKFNGLNMATEASSQNSNYLFTWDNSSKTLYIHTK